MKVEGMAGGRKEQRHVAVHIERVRRGFVGCLVEGGEGVVRRARR